MHASEQERPDVVAARDQRRQEQVDLDPAHLVFIGETWAKTNMARLYGRCARGQRLLGKVPFGKWTTTTLLAALRHTQITAPMVLDRPINGLRFLTYVEEVLAPTLGPGDIVVIDNLGSHRSPGIKAAIEAQGANLRYLPPYSPDLNPIEMAFSKLKPGLRKAAERSVDPLWTRIGRLLDDFTQEECANYFKAAGYAPT